MLFIVVVLMSNRNMTLIFYQAIMPSVCFAVTVKNHLVFTGFDAKAVVCVRAGGIEVKGKNKTCAFKNNDFVHIMFNEQMRI